MGTFLTNGAAPENLLNCKHLCIENKYMLEMIQMLVLDSSNTKINPASKQDRLNTKIVVGYWPDSMYGN